MLVLALCLFSVFGRQLSNTWLMIFYIISMAGTGIAFGNIMTNGQKQVTLEERADANAFLILCNNLQAPSEQRLLP